MSEEQAPYRTSTTAPALARAAHACRERVLHVSGALNRLLGDLRADDVEIQAAEEWRTCLVDELRAAADELEGRSSD